ncbi:MAG: hypothetical protein QF511_06510 [Rhodospirillales bacterium]|jgi:hypothetical protein|nr:hypothetical protein [Rhodospirillales bacterium]HIJ92430.1 hypothetical protein [Rhodospirillaceae bacterium]
MKRVVKIFSGFTGACVLIFVGAVFLAGYNMNSLVKEAVEKFGTEATLAEVKLDKAEISLKSGEGSLKGLKVGNPKGFKTPSAFEMGSIGIKMDIETITQDPIVIKEIVITGPQVTYELAGTNSNIDAIQKNVDAYSKQFPTGENVKKSEGERSKLIIENIYIRGGNIGVSAGFLKGKTMNASLPDIHLKDIGKKEKGVDPSQVIQEVMGSMTKAVGSAVASLGL